MNPVADLKRMFQGWVSPAVRVGDFVFLSGLIGCDPQGQIVSGGTEAQIRRIFEAMEIALKAHGASLQDVVKMTMYYTDRKRQSPILDRIRREIWKSQPPATTGIGISELALGAEVEVDAIAVVASANNIASRAAADATKDQKSY